MGLDVLGLYEAAADKLFDDGHYDRALAYDQPLTNQFSENLISPFYFLFLVTSCRLYHLSNVESSKLIAKFSSKSRMEDIIAHLVTKLRMRECT